MRSVVTNVVEEFTNGTFSTVTQNNGILTLSGSSYPDLEVKLENAGNLGLRVTITIGSFEFQGVDLPDFRTFYVENGYVFINTTNPEESTVFIP
jgi:hypothetical protein